MNIIIQRGVTGDPQTSLPPPSSLPLFLPTTFYDYKHHFRDKQIVVNRKGESTEYVYPSFKIILSEMMPIDENL